MSLYVIIIMTAGATVASFFSLGYGYDPIHMSLVKCTGDETRLVNCTHSIGTCGETGFILIRPGVRCLRRTDIDSIVEYSKSNKCDN